MSLEMRTPVEWCDEFGVDIVDADGWRIPGALPFSAKIGRGEFERRMNMSTVRILDHDRYSDMTHPPKLEPAASESAAGERPKFPLVVVEWEDACNVATWTDTAEAQAFENLDFDYRCTNVGYLIRDDEVCVVVAARADGGFKQVGLIERIPRGMVRNIRRLA